MEHIVIDENGRPSRDYFDILKGIGAFCIVFGHIDIPTQNFFYLFHVPLFFFISGFLYDEEKYGDRPYDNFCSRMKSWGKYILMYIPFVLFHNIFCYLQMLRVGEEYYDWHRMLEEIASVILGDGDELLAGPLWFVPVLVLSSSYLGLVVYLSRLLTKHRGSNLLKFAFQILILGISSILGFYLVANRISLPSHMQISFAVLPYLYVGYLLRNYGREIDRYLKSYLGLIFLVLLIIYSRDHLYSLVDGYVSPMMYLTAFLGCYICMCLAGWIYALRERIPLRRLFIEMGQASFFLMGTHYLIIRSIDRVYAGLCDNIAMMADHYLGGHASLVPIYLLLGIGLPLLLRRGCRMLRGGKL